MSKKRIGRSLERFFKSELGPRKVPFPENLEFLEGTPFYSISLYRAPDSERDQYRVEFTPQSARRLCKAYLEVKELREKYESIKKEHDELTDYCKNLEANNQKLMENLSETDSTMEHEQSPLSYHNVISENNRVLRGRPLQGGLPGQGKRR